MDAETRRHIRHRANNCCEYCRMRQEFDEIAFQIEHVLAKKHHGPDARENLALACFPCNNHMGPNLSGLDPHTGQLTCLFNPRVDKWEEHFQWKGPLVTGRTPIGRTTVDVLAMNLTYRVELRMALMEEGVFP